MLPRCYFYQGGKGVTHYGVCSNYLLDAKINDTVYMFVRR